MPRLIIKNSYIKSGSKQSSHLTNLVNYIGTRDGVEKNNRSTNIKSTTKQKDLVTQILRDFPNAKNSFEYEDYKANPTIENATDFITSAMEQNYNKVGKKENYVGYIACRPNAERVESHGLFTSGDEKIMLSKVAKEIARHEGNVWTPIISLRREEAVATGYDNAKRWKNMLESYVPTIAESMKIPLEYFKWYGAFHNEGHHPHVHMICYSTHTGYGYLNQNGIDTIKSGMMKEIFKEQLIAIYQRQTKRRDELKRESKKVFRELKFKVLQRDVLTPELEQLILTLSDKLKSVKGKKQFGYLQPPIKNIVNAIVDELGKEPRIKKAYELWCELQQEVYESYSDTPPPPILLSQQKEFKSIKNMIIHEVLGLETVLELEEDQKIFDDVRIRVEDRDKSREETIAALTEKAEKGNPYAQYQLGKCYLLGKGVKKERDKAIQWLGLSAQQGNEYAQFFIDNMDKWSNPSVGMCVSRLLGSLGRVFEDTLPQDSTTTRQKIDSKLLRKMREKKLAMGKKVELPEEENLELRFPT